MIRRLAQIVRGRWIFLKRRSAVYYGAVAGIDKTLLRECLEAGPLRLHLGAGDHRLSGWLNCDICYELGRLFYLDVTKPFPIQDNAAQSIYSEHVLEHISYKDGLNMLSESYRVLEPGGRIRIVTPDLERVAGVYANSGCIPPDGYLQFYRDTHAPWAPFAAPVFYLNDFMRNWGHRFLYDRETLVNVMEQSGFKDVAVANLGYSRFEEFVGIDNAGRMPPGFLDFESLVVEASKV